MAEKPYKNFFQARDDLDAELWTEKLTLTSVENLVFRYLLEHALYKPNHRPEDYGFLADDYLGVDTIAKLTGLSERSVKNATKSLKELGLISTFKRPVMSGGRKPDRIRVDWMLSEGALHAPSDSAGDAPSYEAPGAPSYEAGDAPSIYKEEEAFQEVLEEVVTTRKKERTPMPQFEEVRQSVSPRALPSLASLDSPATAPGARSEAWLVRGMHVYPDEPSGIPSVPVFKSSRNSQVFREYMPGTRQAYVSRADYDRLFLAA